MGMDLYEALNILRLDSGANDDIVESLLNSIPSYIYTTTGMTPEQQDTEPLAKTVSGFLLQLWYNAEGTNADQLTRTIDSLLKTLSLMVVQDGK
ncbi:hypothetical protein ACF3NG_10065 [Aerococcaceae bacterium WGS1372]